LLYVDALEEVLGGVSRKPGRDYHIASGGGRMKVTMDRYGADWGMVELAGARTCAARAGAFRARARDSKPSVPRRPASSTRTSLRSSS